MKLTIVIIAMLLLSCAHAPEATHPVFSPVTVPLCVTLHIVPGDQFMPKECRQAAIDQGGKLLGCEDSGNIWVTGYNTPDGIEFDWRVAGHELAHAAARKNRAVAWPDKEKK